MTEPPMIENTAPDTLKSQLAKGLGLFWILSGILLLFCFFISNYSMVFKDFSGLDMVKIVFKDTETLRQVGDTTTFLLMVLIPIFYFGLAVFSISIGIPSIGKKRVQAAWVFTIVSGIVLLLSIFGMFMIGNEAAEVALVSKFMPKPSGGYYFAFFLQLLLFVSGLVTIWQDNKQSI